MIKLFPYIILIFLLGLGCSKDEDTAKQMANDFSAITEKYTQALRSAETDSARQQLAQQKQDALDSLLQEYQNSGNGDHLELVRSRVFIEMKDYDKALAKLNPLIEKGSSVSPEAKLEKVRILQGQNKVEEALTIFKQIEDQLEPNMPYYEVMFTFAFDAKDIKDREKYSRRLLDLKDWPQDFLRYKGYVYENLALIAREYGDTGQAKQILQQGIQELKESGNAVSLESTMKLVNMIGEKAPALSAETWINSSSLSLDHLKGKVVVVDFWAPWCGPCRKVIPTIVDEYNQKKDNGLVVIGYTRLYGRYSDDQKRVGEVSPQQEIGLTKDFIKRFDIKYPVAIAHNKDGFEKYFIRGIPTMIFIDKDGKIADFKIGSGNEQFIRDKIDKLLS